MLQFVQTDLSGRRCFSNRPVGERAAFPQRKNPRGQSDFAHGYSHKTSGMSGELQKTNALRDRPRVRRNLYDVGFTARRASHAARQLGRPIKVVHGEQHTRRNGIVANGLVRQLSLRLHFQVAPGATGLARFHQPKQLCLNIAGKLSTSDLATARG